MSLPVLLAAELKDLQAEFLRLSKFIVDVSGMVTFDVSVLGLKHFSVGLPENNGLLPGPPSTLVMQQVGHSYHQAFLTRIEKYYICISQYR